MSNTLTLQDLINKLHHSLKGRYYGSQFTEISTIPTFTVSSWWMVKGQAQRDDGGNFQDDEGDVLQSLPHQLQERLGLLRGNEVLAECIVTVLQIKGVPGQTCKQEHKNSAFPPGTLSKLEKKKKRDWE